MVKIIIGMVWLFIVIRVEKGDCCCSEPPLLCSLFPIDYLQSITCSGDIQESSSNRNGTCHRRGVRDSESPDLTKADVVAFSSRRIAAARAVESRRADRLFNDCFAELLVSRYIILFLPLPYNKSIKITWWYRMVSSEQEVLVMFKYL